MNRFLPCAAFCLSAAVSCSDNNGGSDTGALLVLTPNLDFNSELEVTTPLDSIQLLLDAKGGFEGVSTGDSKVGNFAVVDPDNDGEAELLYQMGKGQGGRLPVLRLDPGSNQDKEIAVRVRGLDDSGKVAAYGGTARRLLFSPGKLNSVEVPLNLGRTQAPPRVVAFVPDPGSIENPSALQFKAIAFYASRPLAQESVEGRLRVVLSSELVVDQFDIEVSSCFFGTQMWTLTPRKCHETKSLTGAKLEIDPGVTDTEGNALRDSSGRTGFTALLTSPGADISFGPCTPKESCLGAPAKERPLFEMRCDPASELLEPAPCAVARCGDARDRLQWANANIEGNDCGEYGEADYARTVADGDCVVAKPWPCKKHGDCWRQGTDCDVADGYCHPPSCDSGCDLDTLLCVIEESGPKVCLPRIANCAENCEAFGSCPDFGQTCVQSGDDGQYECR